MSFLNIKFSLKLALSSLIRRPISRIITVGSLSVLMVIGAGLFETTKIFSKTVQKINTSHVLMVYLKPAVANLEEMARLVSSISGVQKVDSVTKEKFLENLKKNFPDISGTLENNSAKENELVPDYLKITLNAADSKAVLAQLENHPQVEKVVASQHQLKGLASAVKGFSFFLSVLLCGVVLAFVCILMNHYKSGMDWAIQLKNTLGLLGGSRSVVAGPFLMEGLLEGLAMGLIACAIWIIGSGFFNASLRSIFIGAGYKWNQVNSEIVFSSFNFAWLFLFLGVGLVSGFASSVWLILRSQKQ